MADNVTFQSGILATVPDGSIVATDTIGGVLYQRVKVVWGVDGVATDVSASAPLPVVLTAGAVVIGTVNQGTSPWVISGAVTQSGTWNVTVNTALPAGSNVIGHVITDTGSTTVVTGTVTTSENGAGTGTVTSVASANINTTLLAANASRLGATITNDSTQILYLKLGATASTSSYTVQLAGSTSGGVAYYEVPFKYTGIITGIWAAANGNARVTELTA